MGGIGTLCGPHTLCSVSLLTPEGPPTRTLTYELEGQRTVLPLTPSALERAAKTWTADLVTAWFNRNPQMMFYYVPQVAVFPENGIAVLPEWVEHGDK